MQLNNQFVENSFLPFFQLIVTCIFGISDFGFEI